MNKINTTKKVYQVWTRLQNDYTNSVDEWNVLEYETKELKDAGWYQSKLLNMGKVSWLQIVENNDK